MFWSVVLDFVGSLHCRLAFEGRGRIFTGYLWHLSLYLILGYYQAVNKEVYFSLDVSSSLYVLSCNWNKVLFFYTKTKGHGPFLLLCTGHVIYHLSNIRCPWNKIFLCTVFVRCSDPRNVLNTFGLQRTRVMRLQWRVKSQASKGSHHSMPLRNRAV